MKTVILYTDGACSGNPGPGGWAGLLRKPEGCPHSLAAARQPLGDDMAAQPMEVSA
ncbi:MAG: hypothetical protein IJT62_02580 [Oscillospiraceae bacterium]|nr:hypothetical protein [Oscillospiraceae bacterium]